MNTPFQNRRSSPPPPRWYCVELPRTGYHQAWHLQQRLVAARKNKAIDADTVLILEHPPVFTLGRRGGIENLTVPEAFLKKVGIDLIQVERGGSITFHGPGQLVVYPVLDLRAAGIGVAEYVNRLEEIMIRTATNWGVNARRRSLNRGIWVDLKKMGSVGVAVRHGITFHGLALNVNLSLEPFTWIHPCGLAGIQMTSLAEEAKQNVSIDQARTSMKRHIKDVFNVRLKALDLSVLQEYLSKAAA